MKKIVLITGATSGFGKSCAYRYAKEGNDLILTGRRKERLLEIQQDIKEKHKVDVDILDFDVRNRKEVEKNISSLSTKHSHIDILINNAGLALGADLFQDSSIDDWETMIDTNVKGILYVTRAVLPFLQKSEFPHIINIGSIAGKEVYATGNVYCASKFAVDALTKSMRIDFLDLGIKVSQIAPGAAETEFSIVRYKGDNEKANKVYDGYKPLVGDDIAEIAFWITNLPQHININDLVVMPSAQAGPGKFRKKVN